MMGRIPILIPYASTIHHGYRCGKRYDQRAGLTFIYLVINLLYRTRVSTAPAVPANKPAGDNESYDPNKYKTAPPT